MSEKLAQYLANAFRAKKLPPNLEGRELIVIETSSTAEFEEQLAVVLGKRFREIAPNISDIGGMFFGSKNLIVLSDKPYSNVLAEDMGLTEEGWKAKSLILRRENELTHYYTRKFFGSARNNLHDEIIADFFGIYEAFGDYKGERFLRFIKNRMKVYADGLSPEDVGILENIAEKAAAFLEDWSKSAEFENMSKEERIDFLCQRDLMSYVLIS